METGVMADLVVDYSLLEQVESTLGGLKKEFENIQAQEQGYTGAYGSGDVAGAMDDFAGNWSYHRDKIVKSMEALAKSVHEVVTDTQKFDTDLQTSLTGKK
jgi:hypothetical protein